MRIPTNLLKPLLTRSRIFVAQGTKNIDRTGYGLAADHVRVQPGIELEPYTTFWGQSGAHLVSMGAFSYTHSRLPLDVTVGRYTSIAAGLRVMGDAHPATWASTSPVFYNHKALMRTFSKDNQLELVAHEYSYDRGKIRIGNDVWIGENVTLGHGITIGDGAIVASNATVTKDVPPYAVVGGLPARTLKMRFDEDTVTLLQGSSWWRYSPETLAGLNVSQPDEFAQGILERSGSEPLKEFAPEPLTEADFQDLLS